MDKLDKQIIAAMQEEFPLVANPYRAIAERIGIAEAELLRRLRGYRQDGKIRKMGAVLRHREIGYTANALGVWNVPAEKLCAAGRYMAAHPAVSHCYERAAAPDWPYNLYTMMHGRSRAECAALAAHMADKFGLDDYQLLYSVKEWKKASLKYFCES